MSRPERVSFGVFIGVEIACFILLAVGLLTMCSPFWTSGGVLAWFNDYDPKTDVLGIVWLSGVILSVFVGILLSAFAAFIGIWVGMAAGIIGLAYSRTRTKESDADSVAEVVIDEPKSKPTDL